jgi:transglutaminase-like putative cysteine protease
MTSRRYLSVVAGTATLMASIPLSAVFDQWTWLFQCILAVGLIVGMAILTRSVRAAVWLQVLAMGATLLFAVTLIFPSHQEILAIIPSRETFAHFGVLMRQAAEETRTYGVPVPDRDGLLFVTVLGVGAVAIIVDVVTVTLRRPALAGLPMLAIYSVPVAVLSDAVNPLPFVIGAGGFLWLLVADRVDRVRKFGRRFTGDGRDVDVWEPSPLAAAGRRLALVGLLIAVIVPLAIPGMTGGLIDRVSGNGSGNGLGDGSRGGGARSVDLFAELSGRLNQNTTQTLATVNTDDPNPYYLRLGVADEINPRGFRNRAPSGRAVTRGLPDPRESARTGVTYREHRATIKITRDFDMPFLPVYAEPTRTQKLDSSWFYDPNTTSIFSGRSRSKNRTYSFEFVRSEYSIDALRSAATLPPNDPNRRFIQGASGVREVDDLVARLIEGKTNQYDRVRAIYNYFSPENGFTYSLQTQPGTSAQAIVNFLQKKQGFCEQYAAAMAWLVRAAGIPARVAFGFTRGTSSSENAYTLTNRNLHAWTEVYFAGFGWVPFDATPPAGVVGSAPVAWAPDTATPPELETNAPSVAPSDELGPNGPGDPNRRGPEDPNATTGGPGLRPNATNWPWWVLSGTGVILILLAMPAVVRVLSRRRRHAAADADPDARVEAALADDPSPGEMRVVVGDAAADVARRDAHAAWDELLDTLVDFRVRVDPTETPRSTAERLAAEERLTGKAAESVRLLGYAEERARYARTPLFVTELVASLRTVRRALADRASRRTRLAAVLMPRSVLLRWRAAIEDRSTTIAAAIVSWRASLLRLSPRRLLAARVR